MDRFVACVIASIMLALPASVSAESWSFDRGAAAFFDDSPIFVDARDVVSWDAARSIAAHGDAALQQIIARLHIAQPALPAYEPGTV